MGQQCYHLWMLLLGFGFSFSNSSTQVPEVATRQSPPGLVVADPKNTFHPNYHTDIQDAVAFLRQDILAILSISNAPVDHCRKTLAIVFPELIRYHQFRDFFETTALEQLYVRYGSRGADFSIGPFQMKPSFVEQLEKRIAQSTCLRAIFPDLLLPSNWTISRQREWRLERLKSLEWQFRYASAYVTMMELDGPFRLPDAAADRVRLLATAYNFGFEKSYDQLQGWQGQTAFPYGQDYPLAQFAYGDLSVFAFQELLIPEDHPSIFCSPID